MLVSVNLDGVGIPCVFRFPETAAFFPNVIPGKGEQEHAIYITDQEWNRLLLQNFPNHPATEFSAMTAYLSDAIVSSDRVLVHAVAFRFREKAYLISAPSGVGKSTQVKTLQKLHPGEFGVICGDRPLLRFEQDRIMVCPTPWNGKEGWKGAPEAPLDGIILLERGKENVLQIPNQYDAIMRLFPQMIQTGRNAEILRKTAQMTTQLLTAVPVCKLTSFEVPASTKLLYDALTDQIVPFIDTEKQKRIERKTAAASCSVPEKGKKMMRYKARPGIVTTKICGITTLLPTRSVMDECPHVQCLPLLWAETWKAICDEKPVEVIIRGHEVITRKPREEIQAEFERFCRVLCEKGFLIGEEEADE